MILILSAFLIALSIYVKNDSWRKIGHKDNILLYAVFMTLIIGLRTRYTGSNDTNMYSLMFENINPEVPFDMFYSHQGKAVGNFLSSERGFYFFAWLLAKINTSAQFLIFVTSAINVFSAYHFIKNNSEDKEISFLGFICLGSMTFTMNGMRQALAMSICLFAYEFAKKRKFIPFILTVLLAVLFHKTAVVFVIVYFVCGIKWDALGMGIVSCSAIGFLLFANNIAVFFDNVTDSDYAAGEAVGGGGFITLIIYAICIIATLLKREKLKNDENIRNAFILSLFGMAIYTARYFSIHIYERISFYFYFFALILLAYVPKETKYERILKEGIVLLSFLLFAYRAYGGAFSDFTLFFLN